MALNPQSSHNNQYYGSAQQNSVLNNVLQAVPREPNISEMITQLHQRVASMQEMAGRLDDITCRLLGAYPEGVGAAGQAAPVPDTVDANLRALSESFALTEGRMRTALDRLDRGV